MRPVDRARVHVFVERMGGHARAARRSHREIPVQRFLQLRCAEHARRGAGNGHAHPTRVLRHEYADEREVRRGITEFLVSRAFDQRKFHRCNQLVGFERRFVHAEEKVIGGNAAAIRHDRRVQREHR